MRGKMLYNCAGKEECMLLKEILDVDSDIEISGIGYGGKCEAGWLYFCLNDERLASDAAFAERCKAAAIVTDSETKTQLPQFIGGDVRSRFACASAAFYGNPADHMTVIGITGTNGKTTTSHIVKSIMEADGHKTGLIGTNGIVIGDKSYSATLTTPDPPELHRMLAEMRDCGVEVVVMEVSAHALALRKVDGMRFTVAAFTNLTQDHLDFFKDMQTYGNAKKQLFTPERAMSAVINVDDDTGIEIARSARIPVLTYGCENPSDAFGIEYKATSKGCRFVANIMDEIMTLEYCAPGRFNMSNVLCAATIAGMLGMETDVIRRGVRRVKKVDGRFEILGKPGKRVVVDYAHTPDGLRKILTAVREITPGRVITVFGCGGDRDRGKRSLMGKVASERSDFSVITSDNPRSEDPMEIIREIADGFSASNYMITEDRRAAIECALDMCTEDDTVVIAGKGHESTQETSGRREHFSDAETVRELLK